MTHGNVQIVVKQMLPYILMTPYQMTDGEQQVQHG
jgi:hypothetical protein